MKRAIGIIACVLVCCLACCCLIWEEKAKEAQELSERDPVYEYGKIYINGKETKEKNALAIKKEIDGYFYPIKVILKGIGGKITEREDGNFLVECDGVEYICWFKEKEDDGTMRTFFQEFAKYGCTDLLTDFVPLNIYRVAATSREINGEIYTSSDTATYLMQYFGYELTIDYENKAAYIVRFENPYEKGPVKYELIGKSAYNGKSVRYMKKTEKGEAVTWAEMINTESKYSRIKNRDDLDAPSEIDFSDSMLIITYGRELVKLEYEQDYERTGKSGTALVFTYSNENVGDVAFFYKLKGNVEYVKLTTYSPTYVIDEKGELVFIGKSVYKLDG